MAALYETLDAPDGAQFRLLTILPATTPGAVVACQLAVVPLHHHHEYEALSYCWGDANRRDRHITCNGQRLSVAETVECALKTLRRSDDLPRRIWIDAICINQDDVAERSHQVTLMQHIYRRATRVLVWLGLAYENSNLAIELCQRLAADERNERIIEALQVLMPPPTLLFATNRRELVKEYLAAQNKSPSFSTDGSTPDDDKDNAGHKPEALNDRSGGKKPVGQNKCEDDLQTITEDELMALYRLLKRPYWSRCWVIQEFCLAAETLIICGSRTLDSGTLMQGIVLAVLLGSDKEHGRMTHLLTAGGTVYLMSARQKFQIATNKTTAAPLEPIAESATASVSVPTVAAAATSKQPPAAESGGLSALAALAAATTPAPEPDMLEMLWNFRAFLVTDPRDKVYALLGLVPDKDRDRLGIVPDYELDTATAYTQTSVALLRFRANLDCLTTDKLPSIAQGLPSWVCDWSFSDVQNDGLPLGAWRSRGESGSGDSDKTREDSSTISRPFSASGACHTYSPILEDAKTLVLSGYVTDTLASVARTLNVPKTEFGAMSNMKGLNMHLLRLCHDLFVGLGEYFDTLVEWDDMVVSQPTYPTGEDPLRVFCEILVASNLSTGTDATFRAFTRWRQLLRGPKKLAHARIFGLQKYRRIYSPAVAVSVIRSVVTSGGGSGTFDKTFIGRTEVTMSRALARTEKGFLALVPAGSRPGDKVMLLEGGKLPFIMRQEKGTSPQQWKLLGCSYAHGIMFGEAWDNGKCCDIKVV